MHNTLDVKIVLEALVLEELRKVDGITSTTRPLLLQLWLWCDNSGYRGAPPE